jgi:hypothetical protein
MSTALLDAPLRRHRPLAAARIQMVNKGLSLGMPWAILGSAFLVNLVIWAMIPESPNEPRITGGVMSIYIFVLIGQAFTVVQWFPFALGLSVTRRDFLLGTFGLTVVEAFGQGLVLTLLRAVEELTGGWGIDLTFFGVPYLVQDDWFLQWLVYSMPFLGLAALGLLAGSVYKRFGQTGMWIATIVVILVGGLGAVLLTWQNWWPAFGSFLAGIPPLTALAAVPAIVAVVLGGITYLLLRRATP